MKVRVPLREDRVRPVTRIIGLNALIDTGAVKSVCNTSTEVFEILFDATNKTRSSITGFGGKCDGYEYIVKKLDVGGIIFEDIPFFVPDEHNSEEVLVLAGTIFSSYAYEIDMVKRLFTIYAE